MNRNSRGRPKACGREGPNNEGEIRTAVFLLLWVILAGVAGVARVAAESKIKDLPPKYRTWLSEEVVYIITAKEKAAFLQLESDRERDLFIEAFWRQRDSVPETPENEFKEEHFRRIRYANDTYGKGTSKPGWKTDRGRISIILGKPRDVSSFGPENENLVPIEVWFYQGEFGGGLPSSFYVVFFQEEGIGDYILYSPLRHGPKKLIESYDGDPNQAVNVLLRIDRELAGVSKSLIPGQASVYDAKPTLSSEMMLNKIEVLPQKKVNDLYADKLLKYKSLVEVDSSVNYINSEALLRVIKENDGRYFVHYAVEPNRLSVGSSEGKFFVHLEVFGKVSDSGNKTVYQFQKDVALNFSPEDVTEMRAKRFSFQDAFPMVEGKYRFDLLIKNPVSKEFTSFESDLVVPGPGNGPVLGPVLLSSRLDREASARSNLRPFRMGNLQVYPVADRTFSKTDRLFMSFRMDAPPPALGETGSLEFSLLKEDKQVRSFSRSLKEVGSGPEFSEELSLGDVDPGLYSVVVKLLDQDRKEIGSAKEDFAVSTRRALPALWSVSEKIPPLDDPHHTFVLGVQFLNLGRVSEAKPLLEKAYEKRPVSLEFALGLGQAYFRSSEFQKVQDLLSRFLEKGNEDPQVYELLGRSAFLQSNYGPAIYYLKKYLSHFGTNLEILNILAESFYQSGEFEEARAAWKKSLEMEPRQEEIKKKLEALAKKIPKAA